MTRRCQASRSKVKLICGIHSLLHVGLGLMQPRVDTIVGEQLGMLAGFDDLAALQDNDSVGALQGTEAVGDGDGCAALDQVVERELDFAFGFGVDRGCGFVEDEDARIDQQGAGDADALTFAAGEQLASLANQRVITIGQAENEFMSAGGAGGGDDLIARGVR